MTRAHEGATSVERDRYTSTEQRVAATDVPCGSVDNLPPLSDMAVTMYMCVLTVGLTCLLFRGVSCEVFNNCTEVTTNDRIITTVYNDSTEVTGFPCMTASGKQVCPLWPRNLPNGLSNGSSVAKPRDFGVTLFTETVDYGGSFGNHSCTGAVFTWRVPADQNSRRNTKGYFLRMDRVDGALSNCRIFDLQGIALDSSKINFRFETFAFAVTKDIIYTFVTSLYSLPPPSPDEMEEGLDTYERVVLSIPKCTNLTLYPEPLSAIWTTWILAKNATAGAVEVSFGMADDSLNFRFTQYRVRMFRNGTTSDAFRETLINHVNGSRKYGTYVFKNVPAGAYYIIVDPVDSFYNDFVKCLCNMGPNEMVENSKLCTSCGRSVTGPFTVKDAPLTTVATPNPTPTPTTTTTATTTAIESMIPQSSAMKPEVDGGVVTGAVIGSLALAAAVVAVAFLCWKRSLYPKHRHSDVIQNNLKRPPEKDSHFKFPTDAGHVKKAVPQLKRKRVFLLAAEDHPYHTKAVEMCAEFLRVHCYCDVTFTPQCRAELRGKIVYCWISGEIDQADYVVIVTSMAAYRLYQEFQKGHSFRDADFGPEGDLFTPGLQHICGMITCNTDTQKVVMVHFDHTVSDLRLPIGALPSSLYLLPKHLSNFLKHIHGVDHNSSGLSKVLPLECNISQLPEGNAWLSAIQEAKAFERGYPNWFDEKFGKPSEVTRSPRAVPDFTTQESGFFSNEGGSIGSRNSADLQRRLSSVSMGLERFISGFDHADPRAPVYTITKDDFIEPSMCFSAYTVPPGSTFEDGNLPEEIDDRVSTTSERFRHFNQRYDLDRLEETRGSGVGHYPVVQADTSPVYNTQGCSHSGVTEDTAPTHHSPSRGLHVGFEHAYAPEVLAGVNLRYDDADEVEEDCMSISSAQSV